MKIAVISSGDIPSQWAHSINTMKHAQGFYKLGYNVEVLTVERFLETEMKYKLKNIQEFYDINQKIKIKYFKENLLLYFKNFSLFRHFLIKLYKFVPNIKNFLDPEKKISNYCKKNKIDITYCRAYRATYYNIINKIPTILETHTPFVKKPDLQNIIKLSKSKYFIGLITISNILKNKFIHQGVPKEKILVLEDAVDLEKFDNITKSKEELRRDLGLPLNKKIVMYCGSLKPGKGIESILKTAMNFDQNVQFFIVGGNPKEKKYWKKKSEKFKIKNIIFVGFVKHKLIPKYLKSADILFMPYDTNERNYIMDINTTSPIKLFEYMASKRPIVSLKIPTIKKIVRDKREAYLAKTDKIDDYCELIRTLLGDESLAKKLADNAYKRVKDYTYKNRCKKILNKFIGF